MPKLVLVPNNMKSRGAKALAATLTEKLGYRVWRVRPDRVRRRTAFKLSAGTDKLTQFKAFEGAGVFSPAFTEDINVARDWIAGGRVVVCRTLLRASEGRGIVIAETVDQIVPAKLYTQYVPKKAEYRVHVLNGEVIDVQMKKKRKGFEDERNTRIRNLSNGYVFCRDGIVEPETLRPLAIAACAALNYRLGAVDVAHNIRRNSLVVLEVNATPGMMGTTLENYANAIVKGLK